MARLVLLGLSCVGSAYGAPRLLQEGPVTPNTVRGNDSLCLPASLPPSLPPSLHRHPPVSLAVCLRAPPPAPPPPPSRAPLVLV